MRTGAGIRRIDAREDRDRSRDEGRHRGGGDHADDRGVATVWAATAVAVLISVLAAMLDLAGAVAARHRAEAAADLAALAAAGRAVHGGDSACARAAEVPRAAAGASCCAACEAGRRWSRSRWESGCPCSARPRFEDGLGRDRRPSARPSERRATT
jgi:secretion/DNA translocation related TadE-like protein